MSALIGERKFKNLKNLLDFYVDPCYTIEVLRLHDERGKEGIMMSKSNKVPYFIGAALFITAVILLSVWIAESYPTYDVLAEEAESIDVTFSDGNEGSGEKQVNLTERRKEISQMINRILHFPRRKHSGYFSNGEFFADAEKTGYICKIDYKDQQVKVYFAESEDKYQICIFRKRRNERTKFDSTVAKDSEEGRCIFKFMHYLESIESEKDKRTAF